VLLHARAHLFAALIAGPISCTPT